MKALLSFGFVSIIVCFVLIAFPGCNGPDLDMITFPEPYDNAVLGVRETTWEGNNMKIRYLSQEEFRKLNINPNKIDKIYVKSVGDALLWKERISSGGLFMDSEEIVDLAIKIWRS